MRGPQDLESHPYGGRMDSRWEQLTRLFSNEAKTEAITTTTRSNMDIDLRERLSHYGHHFRRRLDRKLFLISAVVLFGITVVVLELAHLQPNRTAVDLTQVDEPDPAQIEPEYCTTWPVGPDNRTYIPALRDGDTTQSLGSIAPEGGWKKPGAIKVVGLIFYGRRRNVDVLDCYLLQNLVMNGGYLDEVRFIKHTKQEQDLAYLDQLVSQREDYHIVDVGSCEGGDYSCMWDKSTGNNTIYIKIDDDIVCIQIRIYRSFASIS